MDKNIFSIYGVSLPRYNMAKFFKELEKRNPSFYEYVIDLCGGYKNFEKDLKKSNCSLVMGCLTAALSDNFWHWKSDFEIYKTKHHYNLGRMFNTIKKKETGNRFKKSVKSMFKDLGLKCKEIEGIYEIG